MNTRFVLIALPAFLCSTAPASAVEPQPPTAEILKQIVDNVQRSEAVPLETLYLVTVTHYPEVELQMVPKDKFPDWAKSLESIRSETTVDKTYIKRWSASQRNAVRAVLFSTKNGKTNRSNNGGGAHDGNMNRFVQYACQPPQYLIGTASVLIDEAKKAAPGYYPVVPPEQVPWGMVDECLCLSRANHRFYEGHNIGPGLIELDATLARLADRDAVIRDADERYFHLKYTKGSAVHDSFDVKVDSQQSFLPIEIHYTSTSFDVDASIAYRQIEFQGQPPIFVPDSISRATYLKKDGRRDKSGEEQLLVKSCKITPGDLASLIDAPADHLPQFTENDLELLGFAEQEVLERMAKR